MKGELVTPKNSLYAISQSLRDILQRIDDEGGVIDEATEQQLAITQEQLEEKGINYALAIKNFEDNVELADKEIERITKFKNRNEAMAQKLRDKLRDAMVEFGVEKIETPTMVVKITKSKETVITNAEVIPKQFLVYKPTYTPDKKAIKAAIESGEPVNGCFINVKNNLNIK